MSRVRNMTVVRAPCEDTKAMIRIVNRYLTDAGFDIGDTVKVRYEDNTITITKANKKHSL